MRRRASRQRKLASPGPAQNMSLSLNSFKRVVEGLYKHPITGLIKGDTRSCDYSSHGGVGQPEREFLSSSPIRNLEFKLKPG